MHMPHLVRVLEECLSCTDFQWVLFTRVAWKFCWRKSMVVLHRFNRCALHVCMQNMLLTFSVLIEISAFNLLPLVIFYCIGHQEKIEKQQLSPYPWKRKRGHGGFPLWESVRSFLILSVNRMIKAKYKKVSRSWGRIVDCHAERFQQTVHFLLNFIFHGYLLYEVSPEIFRENILAH